MKLTEHFTKEEFDSKDGAEMPADVLENIVELAENLELIRTFLGVSITINSGYRSPAYNKKIGGAKASQHMLGMAGDLSCSLSPDYVADAIEGLIRLGLIQNGGLGRYGTFTHYDIRATAARWDKR